MLFSGENPRHGRAIVRSWGIHDYVTERLSSLSRHKSFFADISRRRDDVRIQRTKETRAPLACPMTFAGSSANVVGRKCAFSFAKNANGLSPRRCQSGDEVPAESAPRRETNGARCSGANASRAGATTRRVRSGGWATLFIGPPPSRLHDGIRVSGWERETGGGGGGAYSYFGAFHNWDRAWRQRERGIDSIFFFGIGTQTRTCSR